MQTTKLTIKWENENLIFPEPDGKLPVRAKLKKVQKPKISTKRKSSCSSADIQLPDIAVIGLEELAKVCETKELDAFIVD